MRIDKEKEPEVIIEYPDMGSIDLNDEEIQRDLIKRGVCVGMPGGTMIFTHSVRIVAGGAE